MDDKAGRTHAEFAAAFLESLAIAARDLTLDDIEQAVVVLFEAYKRGSTIYTIGNGGSASVAAHFASDLGKFATRPQVGFRAIDFASNAASLTAWTNDEGWDNVYAYMLRPWVRPRDVVVAFSVHGGVGNSRNLVGALVTSKRAGATTIGFAGNGGGLFREICDVAIVVPTVREDLVTPLTETLHLGLCHLICARLRELIADLR